MVNCQSISYKLLTINYKLLLALPKVRLMNWALISPYAGNGCPSRVLQLPVTCSPVARYVFSVGPFKWHGWNIWRAEKKISF